MLHFLYVFIDLILWSSFGNPASFYNFFNDISCVAKSYKYSRDLEHVLNVQGIIHVYIYIDPKDVLFKFVWAYSCHNVSIYTHYFETQKGSKIIFLAINNVCQRGLYLQTYYNFVKERQCPVVQILLFEVKRNNKFLPQICSNYNAKFTTITFLNSITTKLNNMNSNNFWYRRSSICSTEKRY